jgi:hypothetical protein
MDKINLGDALDLAEFPDEATKLRQQMVGVRQDIDQLFEASDIADKSTLESARRMAAHGRANLILQLSTVTHLVDAGLVSIDEAINRIEHLQSVFAKQIPGYGDPMVSAGVRLATEWLRAQKKQPRSGWDPVAIPGGLDEDGGVS